MLTYSLAGDAAQVARDFPVALSELPHQAEQRLGIDAVGSLTPSAGSIIRRSSTTAFAVAGHVLVVIFLTLYRARRSTRRALVGA